MFKFIRYKIVHTIVNPIKHEILKSIQHVRLYFLARKKFSITNGTDPFKQFYVDPNDINHILRPFRPLHTPSFIRINRKGHFCPYFNAGLVISTDSNWFDFIEPYFPRQEPLYAALSHRWHNTAKWHETIFFKQAVESVQRGEVVWNLCRTLEDIYYTCDLVDKLILNIKTNGFKESIDPVCVSIGPQGRLIKTGNGQHRIMLGIISGNKIPVHIVIRHKDWNMARLTHI